MAKASFISGLFINDPVMSTILMEPEKPAEVDCSNNDPQKNKAVCPPVVPQNSESPSTHESETKFDTDVEKKSSQLIVTVSRSTELLEPVAKTPVETPTSPIPALHNQSNENYKPRTLKFWLIIISTFASLFLVALDRTILATAIPSITDEYGSLGDIGWYGSAYMLTTAAFQLLFGRIYRFYDLRWTFLICILVFEVGSTVSGVAPSSPVFILGRAVAGVGAAGIMTGTMMILISMVPLHKRPMCQSLFALVFGFSSVLGPLVGGAFTREATWRWCFYMNLPIGAVVFACLFFFLQTPNRLRLSITFAQHIKRLDPLGTMFFIAGIVCLVLALQWGGSTYAWSDWRIVLLFAIFGLAMIAFGVIQVLMPEIATVPVHVITQRSMLAGACFSFLLASSMMLCIFYLPLWFQTTHRVDPVESSLYTIPLLLPMAIAGPISGAVTQRTGYYVPSMLLCPCLMIVGEGLLTTFTPATGAPQWIGYQILVGCGLGFGMQTVGLAAQTVLQKPDIPIGVAIGFFTQQSGGAIFVSVGQSILNRFLVARLADLPGLTPTVIVNSGAIELQSLVAVEYSDIVIHAYNDACITIYQVALVLSCAQLVCACCMEWKSIKKGKPMAPGQKPSAPRGCSMN
ncbi:hypothetical protein S7711_00828 [Stachybotrys chartarum IBT 7711]|uniref:Major facilitator superfamily (MFS) profile domain-containing protein n=1 Tax=Stachybotrys chartarum (strain CBS 109288 / IBT 7711) TaxID=1280523 RepID=A0A084B0B2_STACB|nr:hypothetical protein S7711_00828 [Stachybotrys chartarum IBT 7711]KFA46411.1 hypothetical protein S40293_07974 [Stachybotrys chartarum IBT 40293]